MACLGGRRWHQRVTALAVLVAGGLLGSCRAPAEWNPFVEVSGFERIVVEDFAYPEDPSLGRKFADQVASELVERGLFEAVLRQADGGPALAVYGRISDFEEGNVAARLKLGRGVGEGRLAVSVAVRALPSGQEAGRFTIRETTLRTGPDARRTGREDGAWLRRRVAERIADEIEARR